MAKMTEIERVEKLLHAACQRVVAAGGYLNDGYELGVNCDGKFYDGSCCLLGAVCFGQRSRKHYLYEAADRLSVTQEQAEALEDGFMGRPESTFEESLKEYGRIGLKMRKTYYGGWPAEQVGLLVPAEPGQ